MRSQRRSIPLLLALALAAAIPACDGSLSGPGKQVSEDELVFARATPGAPPLERYQVSFWAVAGEGREVEIDYAAVGRYDGDECLEFKVPGNALLFHPDGRRVQRGDSVLITIRVVDPILFNFEFSPSGLRFDPEHPAEMRVFSKWVDRDVNGDGRVDDEDEELDENFAIWKQEAPGQDWFRIGTVRRKDVDEFRAEITGFTKYALATGRRGRASAE